MVHSQAIQYFVPGAREWFVDKENKGLRKKKFLRARETSLLWICYTTFCQTFLVGTPLGLGSFLLMFLIVFVVYMLYATLNFGLYGLGCLNFSRADRLCLLFCGTQKTVAMGIPLMSTIFEDNDNLGIYVVPLLIYHPLQLIVGSLMTSKLAVWAEGCPVLAAQKQKEVEKAAQP